MEQEIFGISTSQREEISRFLDEHTYLSPILEEAREKIVSIFGDDVVIHLELYYDMDAGFDRIFIVIKSKYDAIRSIELENRLDEEWFRSRDNKGRLHF